MMAVNMSCKQTKSSLTLSPWVLKLAYSCSVPAEVQASYVVIIDSILAASDLNTITSKRIREGLQRAVDYDITPQKVHLPSDEGACSADDRIRMQSKHSS